MLLLFTYLAKSPNQQARWTQMVSGRCMKCRVNVEMQDPVESVTKNNMRIMKGKCPKCGTTVCHMMGKAITP